MKILNLLFLLFIVKLKKKANALDEQKKIIEKWEIIKLFQ